MGLRWWNVGVLVSLFALWMATGTQREKPVIAEGHDPSVRMAEDKVACGPSDPDKVRELAQSYLDAHAPGLAMHAILTAEPAVQNDIAVQHVYARALVEQGRAADALAVEQKVVDRCANAGCPNWLHAS